MLRSFARVSVSLDIDNVTNRLVERLYSNSSGVHQRFSRRFQILAYHKVSPEAHPFFEAVDPLVFEQQILFLKRCYKVMDLEELVERSRRGEVPERAVAITFDDGYRDNYEHAFPILKRHGLPATIFLVTGVIGTGEVIWHDRIFDSFRFATRKRARLRHTDLPELILETVEAQHQSLKLVLDKAKGLHGEGRLRFVEEVERALQPAACQPQRMLNWEQVREMRDAGIAFGSHSVTHPVLSRIPRAELVKELRESKRVLSDHLGAPIRAFAYPNGKTRDYNHEVKMVLKECGYTCAATCEWGFNPVFSDPYALKRGLPWHREIELFRLRFFLQRHGLDR